jgi:ankyrin repeat protein
MNFKICGAIVRKILLLLIAHAFMMCAMEENQKIDKRKRPEIEQEQKQLLRSCHKLPKNETEHKLSSNGMNTFAHFLGAVKRRDISLAKMLLATEGFSKKHAEMALGLACVNGNIEVAQALLQAGVNPDNVLIVASKHGNIQIANLLIEHGASVNAQDLAWQTPLIIASINGHANMVKFLIEHGADTNHKDGSGKTALTKVRQLIKRESMLNHWAIGAESTKNKALKQVEMILARGGCRFRYATSQSAKPTALKMQECGEYDDANAIITKALESADFNPVDTAIKNLWFTYAQTGNDVLAEILFSCGNHPNVRDNYQRSPLMCAVINNGVSAAKKLIDYGAELDTQDINGWTPLICAVVQGHKELVELLIARGADVNKPDLTGGTPLAFSIANGRREITQLLIAHGAKLS